MKRMERGLFRLLLLAACGAVVSCGGGGGSGSSVQQVSSGPMLVAPSGPNVASVVVDDGPIDPATGQSVGAYNTVYVSVTLCVPGTTQCKTIDHVQVDTGSVGVRIFAQAINDADFVAALPQVQGSGGQAVGECYQYVTSYVWGAVRKADFSIAGESASAMPLQIIGDPAVPSTAPSDCVNSGGTSTNTIGSFGANGIIGIGVTSADCPTQCAQGAEGPAAYFSCTASACTLMAMPNGQQVPNPVSQFPVDNNGSSLTLEAVQPGGQTSATGYLVFGIGTQSNNGLGTASVLRASADDGFVSTTFQSVSMPQSYVDSGTAALVFVDSGLARCTVSTGFYCPSTLMTLQAEMQGSSGPEVGVEFWVGNVDQMPASFAALPAAAAWTSAANNSFAWGLPFFYNRTVYTAIQGVATPAGPGPYYAF